MMSEEMLRYLLPVYFVTYVILVFFWRVWMFKKKNGKNPVILGATETAHGYISRISIYLIVLVFLAIVLFSFFPAYYQMLRPFDFILHSRSIGLFFLIFSLFLTMAAQIQMGASWRVGIETKERTQIVSHGIYRFSRNPIYVGVYLANLGFFLVIPNVATLIVFLLGHVALQVIIRLEEAHMSKIHGEAYYQYSKQVRRWI